MHASGNARSAPSRATEIPVATNQIAAPREGATPPLGEARVGGGLGFGVLGCLVSLTTCGMDGPAKMLLQLFWGCTGPLRFGELPTWESTEVC